MRRAQCGRRSGHGGALGQPLLRVGEFALEVGDNLLRIG